MILPYAHSRRGFALVLVLLSILLVVGLVLAFFSSSLLQHQISTSSANREKVDLFAEGALATTIGDLKQEIIAGSVTHSTAPPLASLTAPIPAGIYWPKAPANMVPARVGTLDGLPNLVKTSAYNQPFYPGGTSRGSQLGTSASSTRPISPTRWNAPILLPMPSGHADTDLTPVGTPTGFTPPNWIYVDRYGANPQTATSDVVGRYAYSIYDEGGLLDLNVAGYPDEMSAAQAAYKVGSSFADLTQLFPAATPGVKLTLAQIDMLLGWRNFASAQPDGSFPSYTFAANTSAANYFRSVLTNPLGFLSATSGMSTANGTTLYKGQSDQKFVSRQQFLSFMRQSSLNASPDVLQYMGTFSRALDQPSYRPDPNRPLVKADAGNYTGNVPFTAVAGGNDSFGVDDQVNPFFLGVPVTVQFPRNDGTQAVVGEPLVKKRFPLNRLAWITYKGPSADNMTDKAVQQTISALGGTSSTSDPVYQFVAQGTAGNISTYFGLKWQNGYWIYDHGLPRIGRLSDIQGIREPDFFELLKASLTVGALGKSSASSHSSTPLVNDSDQYECDITTGYQALQIGANIIDQFDADSYPTHIQYVDSRTIDIYGSENIPGLYRSRAIGVNLNHKSPPEGAMLVLPEVWNPYDPASPRGVVGPTDFRILAAGDPVVVRGKTHAYAQFTLSPNYSYEPEVSSRALVPHDPAPALNAGSYSFTPNGLTELDFSVPTTSTAANQPLFIGGLASSAQASSISMKAGGGNNIYGLANDFGAQVDSNTGYVTDVVAAAGGTPLAYCGILIGTFRTQWTGTDGLSYPLPQTQAQAPPPPNDQYWNAENPSTSDQCESDPVSKQLDFFLQYKDASGTWITCENKHSRVPYVGELSVAKAVGNTTAPRYIDIRTGPETGSWITWMDPRTSRFGSFDNDTVQNKSSTYTFAADATVPNLYYGVSDRPDATFGCGSWKCTPGTGVTGSSWTTSLAGTGPLIGWFPGGWTGSGSAPLPLFVPGFYADNAAITRTAPNPQAYVSGANYFADPDGVVRRGMGGYAADNVANTVGLPLGTPGSMASAPSRPYILNRPFRSVAELGYVFSGTPWRNLDFSTPESGAAALLDVFCLNETPDPGALVAGKVNLNTRQAAVLQALLSGNAAGGLGAAYKDEVNSSTTTGVLSSAEIGSIATLLVQRTSSLAAGQGPLENVAELVGKWNGAVAAPGATGVYNIDGSKSYVGFSSDRVNHSNSLDQVFAGSDLSTINIQRMRESAIRALSSGGQTRVWNLMIDLVAQTGKSRPNDSSLDHFLVDGEQRYWLHVAIDRFTAKVVDEQLEAVKE